MNVYKRRRKALTNIRNEPVERTPKDSPYSYDTFQLFKDISWNEGDAADHSDRMWECDPEKYNKCCRSVWNNSGQYFYDREPEDIEKFLQLYFDDPSIKLTGVEESCNSSNGYPYWTFYMKGESFNSHTTE